MDVAGVHEVEAQITSAVDVEQHDLARSARVVLDVLWVPEELLAVGPVDPVGQVFDGTLGERVDAEEALAGAEPEVAQLESRRRSHALL